MANRNPSVIVLGSKPGAAVALSILIERGWDIRKVVVSPEFSYPWINGLTIEELALKNNIDVVTQQQSLYEHEKVDFVISYMYRYKVKPETISIAERAAVNFHAGPLPEFGGWAFYNLAILENSPEYGCTCHYMDNGFDTGPLLKVNRFPIDAQKETAYSLEGKTQEEMIRLFIEFCNMAENQEDLPKEEQEKNKMRYFSKLEFEKLKEIPKDSDEETIDKYARAFWYPPYQCAYTIINGAKVEVIPNIAKEQIAGLLHQSDFTNLMSIKAGYNKTTTFN